MTNHPTAERLVVENLSKTYGSGATAAHILDNLNITVEPGEFVCIVGPSGAGKTTLLRCLSGLMACSEGGVRVGEKHVTEPLEEIGLVFQDYRGSLMPWMRSADNVALPLEGKGVPRKERFERAQQCLAAVGLPDVGDMYPWELSGGMQQRVAIARALAYDARILLMDEPFGSLDAQTRFELEDLILDLRRTMGISVVLVTHDIDEAVYLSDRVIVLSGKPATVVDTVEIDLGPERDQIKTKADTRFAEYRSRILGEIKLKKAA
ncbi:ABC transporter ATP-binding protein [Cognatishimia sp. SS12]|uniref:ABC transporter ATP-binding protein n=1 Tax=Cognatishimia sp. SS12 TaxID=2979465 RepID=UPI00232E9A7F|nr:ABC transporter ATP-binding protein [Cognatishimia sp. SS12]MDC0739384.1 ABC transporter ATP-binding protein [Cognatishimia sp. SS12]